MCDLLLSEREQAAVRAVLAADPVPGVLLPGEGVLQHLARLIVCDTLGIALLDGTGAALGEAALGPSLRPDEEVAAPDGVVTLGIGRRGQAGSPPGWHPPRGVAVLSLGVRNGAEHVVMLWLVRRTSDFADRDCALLGLVAPALERLLRERPTSMLPPSLTLQERRVLHHVAAGLSNAEIADRLVVAPCTVRKHLENAYRKLGVSNRLAAVNALQGGRPRVAGVADRVDA